VGEGSESVGGEERSFENGETLEESVFDLLATWKIEYSVVRHGEREFDETFLDV